ncbi:hypothetical protein CSV72_09930 [Sporosarcina sp. P20a]|uniref:hypothetical protein n=1 Tax=Sporosarcina sp. P20a TaxID=2048256 RepID=UPI000C16B274|nr:hypothetical protein [Sporosarcina sp. P20a]PIC86125.1 hypothetical protein CSV72_09930 [Sporosarcina sp. P20a]
MSKCEKVSKEWLFFFGLIAGYALLGLFLIIPAILPIGNAVLLVLFVFIVTIIVLFALAIILKGLSRLFHHRKH